MQKTNWKARTWQALLILIGLLAVFYIYISAINMPIAEKVQVIAHRGGAEYAPGNTVMAFENAIADGVDWLEMDVQETKDGVLVLFHDDTVEELGGGKVNDYTLTELRAIDLGEGQSPPTFEEVIALAKAHNAKILPEAKNPADSPDLEAKMIDLILSMDYAENTIVQSFSPETLDQFHRDAPSLELCTLYGLSHMQWNLKPPYPGDSKYLCIMSEMVFLNPLMISQAHAQGRQVFVYPGVFSQAWAYQWAMALGVDGLIVDDYLTLAEILGQ